MKFFAGVKEFFRKSLVNLKRKPQTVAMLVLVVAFVYYSFNLTHVSDTTAYIQATGMGLSGFVMMLFSVLGLVCFLNAFPHRKKANVPMLVLMFAMLGATLFCNYYYGTRIDAACEKWRMQYVTEAKQNIANARAGVPAAAANAENAAVYAAEADAYVVEVTALQADVAAAAETTTAGEEVAKAAVAAADKAVTDATKAAKTANGQIATAQTQATKAADNLTTLEALLATEAAEGVELPTLDKVNSAAKAVNNAVASAAKAAGNAMTQRDLAAAAVTSAQGALATVAVKAEDEAPVEGAAPADPTAEPAPAPAAAETVNADDVVLPEHIVDEAIQKGEKALAKTLTDRPYINATKAMLGVHRIMLLVAVALVALLPVYAPIIRKINTSIEVEANAEMGEIELDAEE